MKKNYIQPVVTAVAINTNTSLLTGSDTSLGLNSNSADAVDGDAVLTRKSFNIWGDEEDY